MQPTSFMDACMPKSFMDVCMPKSFMHAGPEPCLFVLLSLL